MVLPTGTYIITSKADDSPVGRLLAEDRSLNPKRVVVLPKDNSERPTWILEKLGNSTFMMKIRGSYTADINNLLFAVLVDSPRPTEWKIEPQFHLGKNTYTIVSANNRAIGWSAPIEKAIDPQITVRPLLALPSYPPNYPPFQLFVITEIDG